MYGNNFERILVDKFLDIYSKHNNGKWAIEELEWLVFAKHRNAFESLTLEDQWHVRRLLDALRKVHG